MVRRHRLLCSILALAGSLAVVAAARGGPVPVHAALQDPNLFDAALYQHRQEVRERAFGGSHGVAYQSLLQHEFLATDEEFTDYGSFDNTAGELTIRTWKTPELAGVAKAVTTALPTGEGAIVSSAPAPVIIAAPLPPAIISGIIGLACVYAYRRKHGQR